ncbi:VOC family protein [Chitinilyticum litopenaei]|uniref:VOC family protein n=1 Tax=Chitinilyticum litopenaei TaxID=1121276 RepID=UPI0003F94AAC|nr:glyoxalase/bleomycin resistance/dioxygenase family protein [Chitinilyticum litopenaei]
MFKKIECVCIHTRNIDQSLAFYASVGLQKHWEIERALDNGRSWRLIGLKFPQNAGSELVLSNHPDNAFTEIEILVDDVRQAHAELSGKPGVTWIREPFATESGHVAVMQAPDGNVFVLVGR